MPVVKRLVYEYGFGSDTAGYDTTYVEVEPQGNGVFHVIRRVSGLVGWWRSTGDIYYGCSYTGEEAIRQDISNGTIITDTSRSSGGVLYRSPQL